MSPSHFPPAPVVITADDFGMSADVNSGIVSAFRENLITGASAMANMPAFDEAVAAAHELGVTDRIGVHLNLSEGPALSEQLRGCPRFCAPDGTLVWQHRMLWRIDAAERAAVAAEWRAQLDALVAGGIRPAHLDSHHHVHTAWPLAAVAVELAREYGVRALRLTRTCGPRPSLPVRVYKRVLNARIRRAGLATTEHFGAVADVGEVLAGATGPVEVMTHPVTSASGEVVDRPYGSLKQSIHRLGVAERLVPHHQLVR